MGNKSLDHLHTHTTQCWISEKVALKARAIIPTCLFRERRHSELLCPCKKAAREVCSEYLQKGELSLEFTGVLEELGSGLGILSEFSNTTDPC